MGLKNMSDFRELCFKKIMRNVICCLKVHRYLTKFFRLKIVLIITKPYNGSPENIKMVYVFQILWIVKNKIYVSTHQMQRANNDRVRKICLELKMLMSKFLDVRSSHPKVSCKKGVPKFRKAHSKISVRQSLIKFHPKGQ